MSRFGLRWPLVAALALLLQGCATPGRSVSQSVQVETPGCTRARCELSNDRGRWSLAATPATVDVLTSAQPLQVSCQSDEGDLETAAAPASVPSTGQGAVVGGVAGGATAGAVFGSAALAWIPVLGVIAMGASIAAGAVAGQAADANLHSFGYPGVISIPMRCDAADSVHAKALPVARFGLGVRGVSGEQARQAGLSDAGAVLVTRVAAGGLAASAGLQVGDFIVEAQGQPLHDATDFAERLASLAPGETLRLRVVRDGRGIEMTLQRRADAS
jgi:hypothetical protein